MKVSATPTTVIWFGVTGTRPSADINASARRRTQASNRVVNIYLLNSPGVRHDAAGCRRARLFVDLDDLGSHRLPRIAPCFLVSVGAHPAPELGVPGEDDQRRAQLGPALGLDGHAVAAGLEHRHVSLPLSRDDRAPP